MEMKEAFSSLRDLGSSDLGFYSFTLIIDIHPCAQIQPKRFVPLEFPSEGFGKGVFPFHTGIFVLAINPEVALCPFVGFCSQQVAPGMME